MTHVFNSQANEVDTTSTSEKNLIVTNPSQTVYCVKGFQS